MQLEEEMVPVEDKTSDSAAQTGSRTQTYVPDEEEFVLEATATAPAPARDVEEVRGEIAETRQSAEALLAAQKATSTLRSRLLLVTGVVVILFLVFEFGLSGLLHRRSQQLLLTEYQSRVAGLSAPAALAPVGSPVALLQIPSIGLSEVVVEGTTADALKEGPGHLRNTPFPGQPGNVVIAGRRTTYGGPFRNIGNLRAGDAITVTTPEGKFAYVANAAYFVGNDERDPGLSQTGDNRISLVTSDPEYFSRQRLVVTGDLSGSSVAATVPNPLAVDSNELGLASDLGALPMVVLTLLIAGAAIFVLPRAYAKFPLRAAYLITTPILIAALVLLFINVDRLLPAML